MDSEKNLELARIAFPNDENLRVAYMLGLEKGYEVCEQQMMKEAIERTVKIDAGGYPYIDCDGIELYDYDKDIPLAKEGDKYKVVLIKEE